MENNKKRKAVAVSASLQSLLHVKSVMNGLLRAPMSAVCRFLRAVAAGFIARVKCPSHLFPVAGACHYVDDKRELARLGVLAVQNAPHPRPAAV